MQPSLRQGEESMAGRPSADGNAPPFSHRESQFPEELSKPDNVS
jgi:hypothetical protein